MPELQVILITGANRGIGRAIADHFTQDGVDRYRLQSEGFRLESPQLSTFSGGYH